MFLPITMTITAIVSGVLGLLLLRELNKEKEPLLQLALGVSGFGALCLAGVGILGIIAKTFELWGNNW